MEQRLSLVTLAVADIPRARAFYERLGWRPARASAADCCFFQLNGMGLALYGRDDLARDIGASDLREGFRGVTLAQNVRTVEAVHALYRAMIAAGATALKPPHRAAWGGTIAFAATVSLLRGALGSAEGIGFTLYYATNFIFTGLAVALAYRAGLFNIGGEGQAYVAGLGATLVALAAPGLPMLALLPLAMLGAAMFGAMWAAIPGWLQAKRGSHVVITTIMFNWLASVMMSWLLVNHLRTPQNMQPESAPFPAAAHMPTMRDMAAGVGVSLPTTPLNLSFVLALACAGLVWLLLWRTKLGYEIRAVGENAHAAVTAGIRPARIVIVAMAISGALAAGVATNEVMGVQHRLILDFPAGAGFVGVAVALMGRAHPVGVVLASLLFGLLYQGGTELAFDMPQISRDMIVVIQGLVVLFAGAMGDALKQPLTRLIGAR